MTALRDETRVHGLVRSDAAAARTDGLTPRSQLRPAVIVPCFNHGHLVAEVLDGVLRAVPEALIIAVDDGSTDRTSDAFADWIATNPDANFTIVFHRVNRGKAAALRSGFETAAAEGCTHAATIDADGQLDPADIPMLLGIAAEQPTALILGSRPIAMEGCPARCDVGRRFTSLAVAAQCGIRLADTQCGLRVYPLALVDRLRCVGGRYSFEAEFITRAAWAGAPIIEAPVRCAYFDASRRVSHFRPWRDSLRQAALHVRLLFRALWPVGIHRARTSHATPLWRRALAWINPLRSLREARGSDLGRMEFAAAIGVGAIIGATPFFGLHTAMSVYTAWRLHLHPAGVVLGSQVSIPPLGFIIAAASIWLGHLLLFGRVLGPAELSALWEQDVLSLALESAAAWLVGGIPLAFVIGTCVFFVVFGISGRLRRSHLSATHPA